MASCQIVTTSCKRSSRFAAWLRAFSQLLISRQERKYFDSGDYALSKAGKASDAGVTTVGSQHPNPENIPHLASPVPNGSNAPGGNGNAGSAHPGTSVSPVKESRFKSEDADKPAEEQGKLPEDVQASEAARNPAVTQDASSVAPGT